MNIKIYQLFRATPVVLTIIACLVSFASGAPAAAPVAAQHDNKTDYLSISTGSDMAGFKAQYPGFSEKETGSFLELEKRAALDKAMAFYFRRPKDKKFFDRFVRHITVKTFAAKANQCNFPTDAVSLSTGSGDKTEDKLYSYSFLVCADDPQVTPARMLDKYVEKYGLYDVKDWDREQYVYYKVKSRYKVMVKPLKTGATASLLITVVDDELFAQAYTDARFRLRKAENATTGKF
jgi:hypothetical protein